MCGVCVRFVSVWGLIHLSPHAPTQSHKGPAMRMRERENWRGSCLFANVRLTLELRGSNTKHTCASICMPRARAAIQAWLTWVSAAYVCVERARACRCTHMRNRTQQNMESHAKPVLTSAYACSHTTHASRDKHTHTHSDGDTHCFSRFLSDGLIFSHR